MVAAYYLKGRRLEALRHRGRPFWVRPEEEEPGASPAFLELVPGYTEVRRFDAATSSEDRSSDLSRSIWRNSEGEPFFFSARGGAIGDENADFVAESVDDTTPNNWANVGEREQVLLGTAKTHEGTEPAIMVGIRRRRGTGDPVPFDDRAPGELATFHNRTGNEYFTCVEGEHWSRTGPATGEVPAFRPPAIFAWRSQYVPVDMFDGTYETSAQGVRPKYPGIRRPEWMYFQQLECRRVKSWGPWFDDTASPRAEDATGVGASRPAPDEVATGYVYRRTEDGWVSVCHNGHYSIEFDQNESAWSYTTLDGNGNVIFHNHANLHLQPREGGPPGGASDRHHVQSNRTMDIEIGPPGAFVEWMVIFEAPNPEPDLAALNNAVHEGGTEEQENLDAALSQYKAVYCKRSVNDRVEGGGNGKWKAYYGYSLDSYGRGRGVGESPTWDAWFAARSDWLERMPGAPEFASGHGAKGGGPSNYADFIAEAGKSAGQMLAEVWTGTTIGLSSRVSPGSTTSTWLFDGEIHQGSQLNPDPFAPYDERVPVADVFDAFEAQVTRATTSGTDANGNPIYATTTPLSLAEDGPWVGMSHAVLMYLSDDPRVPETPEAASLWHDAPAGFSTALLDTFEGVEGTVDGFASWQGVDRSKWEVRGLPRTADSWNPGGWNNDDGTREPTNLKLHTAASHVLVPTGSTGLRLYGGRGLDAAGGYPLADVNRRIGEIRTRASLFQSPCIVRLRVTWRQLAYYNFNLWGFGDWQSIDINGQAIDHGWEMDIETSASDYVGTAGARSFRPHFNFHIWQQVAGNNISCQHVRQATINLPDDEDTPILIECRVAGFGNGDDADFFDPTRTYWEWWIEDVQNGVPTGQMVRRYHMSPRRHVNYAAQNVGGFSFYRDIFADWDRPLSYWGDSTIEAIAGEVNRRNNPYTSSPYLDLGGALFLPPSAAHDPADTWLHSWRRVYNRGGRVILTAGFYGSEYFLQDAGSPMLATYQGDPSFVDEYLAFTARIDGVAVFEPA